MLPKTYIRNSKIEIGKSILGGRRDAKRKPFEFYHKKIGMHWHLFGIRFKRVGYYIILKF